MLCREEKQAKSFRATPGPRDHRDTSRDGARTQSFVITAPQLGGDLSVPLPHLRRWAISAVAAAPQHRRASRTQQRPIPAPPAAPDPRAGSQLPAGGGGAAGGVTQQQHRPSHGRRAPRRARPADATPTKRTREALPAQPPPFGIETSILNGNEIRRLAEQRFGPDLIPAGIPTPFPSSQPPRSHPSRSYPAPPLRPSRSLCVITPRGASRRVKGSDARGLAALLPPFLLRARHGHGSGRTAEERW